MDGICAAIFAHTPTLGVRLSPGPAAVAAPRPRRASTTAGTRCSVKRGFLDGAVVTAQPEYDEVKAAADATGQPLRRVLEEVRAAVEV